MTDLKHKTEELGLLKGATLDTQRPQAVAKQAGRGKLTARQRLDLLVDSGSFIEWGQLARAARDIGKESPADGVIVGLGKVDRRPVAIVNYDFTVMGGTQGYISHKKVDRIQKTAREQGVPVIYLLDGGGARAQEIDYFITQDPDIWYDQACCSGWIPMVAGVMGPCYAGHANMAGLSDFVVMVEGTSSLGNAGPPLVRETLGLEISTDELGGARMHTTESGAADLAVPDDRACIAAIKSFLSFFPSNSRQSPPVIACQDPVDRREEQLLTLVPFAPNQMYDMREVIVAIVDNGDYLSIKPNWASSILTCLARMNGRPVGIVANQPMVMAGALDTHASEKMAHFVEMCDAFNIPLIFLVDVPGFMVGPADEQEGLARRSMKTLYALSHSSVPLISVVLRKSFGIAGYVMGSRPIGTSLYLGWPSARMGGMGIGGIVEMMYRDQIACADDPQKLRTELMEKVQADMDAVGTAAKFRFDDIIDPRDTRWHLIRGLENLPRRRPDLPFKKHGVPPI